MGNEKDDSGRRPSIHTATHTGSHPKSDINQRHTRKRGGDEIANAVDNAS